MNEMESVREKIYLRVVIYLRLSNEDRDKINKDDDMDDFWSSSYMVIIDVKKKTCCKFDFYGHKTDGIKILAKPRKGRHFIYDACFDIKFIYTIDGNVTPYILISYLDYDENYRCDEDDSEGYIYTYIYNQFQLKQIVALYFHHICNHIQY